MEGGDAVRVDNGGNDDDEMTQESGTELDLPNAIPKSVSTDQTEVEHKRLSRHYRNHRVSSSIASVPDIRRSHSSTLSFSDERSPGAFASLGSLPRRKSSQTALPARKSPVFHLNNDHDDYSSSSDSVDDGPQPALPELTSSTTPPPSSLPEIFSGSLPPPAAIPFPRSSSSLSSPSPPTSRPPLARGLSSPILLSNGKPLKSSLKSCSTPSIASDSQPQHLHLRARSEPPSPVIPHKNVHFPDQEGGLATIRVFSCSARPAALSNPASNNGEETETEGDDAPPDRFSFPAISPPHYHYEIDPVKSSPVPSHHSSQRANVHIDSLMLSPSPSSVGSKPQLSGSVLVRNIAFEKHVAIRFTLDEWQTVSEVSAHYLDSIPVLPSHVHPSSDGPPRTTVGDLFGPLPKETGWDRFTFNIRLEDYAHSLSTRVLWLAARYRVNSTHPGPDSTSAEWWDNNSHRNYRISFRPALSAAAITLGRPRRDTTPAHIFSSQNKPSASFTRGDHTPRFSASSRPSNEISSPTSCSGPKDKSTVPHAGKLSLSNYASPMTHATSSVSSSDATTPRRRSPPPLITSVKPAPPFVSNRDESPASSTLSTPSLSPTLLPHVILGGHPVTSIRDDAEEQDVGAHPAHLHDWEWSAPTKRSTARPPRQFSDSWPVPGGGSLGFPNGGQFPGQQGLNNESLYKAFVTQWCFAQEPSPNHSYGSDGGVLA
ncbi:carbohydrate-binding module family 21 protein [Paxillus rubicundulus Ve08.2h10]|uniref:Carbohydrate-binding module family 21 protein n=1 Tax=Paxillus rubicundulus Ve08.2h10 TaxID=930991 RepID=A0A0D0E1Z5_9AGAM|nr:carbohydrate-binding module family 21 protein [Paxillus rubicundulus Ve08.2h10]